MPTKRGDTVDVKCGLDCGEALMRGGVEVGELASGASCVRGTKLRRAEQETTMIGSAMRVYQRCSGASDALGNKGNVGEVGGEIGISARARAQPRHDPARDVPVPGLSASGTSGLVAVFQLQRTRGGHPRRPRPD